MGEHLGSICPNCDTSSDPALLVLERRFIAIAAELEREVGDLESSDGYSTMGDEALLACLDPIERAIMETPAHTIAGLGVKARHLAYVVSEYWEAPIDQISWEGRAVRLLIETVCSIANAPLRIEYGDADPMLKLTNRSARGSSVRQQLGGLPDTPIIGGCDRELELLQVITNQ
ncbi:hypothetical protein QA640_15115 [Bradyrhizobium sp. CB82]|nr:hypothetical protein [Bradyrhizobium sp. CB82]WFU43641.1 hypothetical protein QA640_15115 [Bradyrhizobium sp. CB82]